MRKRKMKKLITETRIDIHILRTQIKGLQFRLNKAFETIAALEIETPDKSGPDFATEIVDFDRRITPRD